MPTESMERVGTRVLGEQSRRGVRYWAPPIVGAVIYPELIDSFSRAVDSYRSSGNLLHDADAALLLLLAGSITVFAGRALLRMRQDDAGRVLLRSLLYLMFSVPPLHILSGEVAWLAGVKGPAVVAIWTAGWILAAVALYFRRADALPKRQGIAIVWLRVVHGAVALCLLCGFLLAHLINHDMALWSVKLHGQVMEWLRHWYRSEWVEPALLVLLGVMIATGVPLVSSHSRQRADSFRILQMATGVYLGLFICAHVFAVLAARQGGIETDWYFGVGPHGLLVGRGALIAYYIYSAFFLILHAGFGLRIVLLKHGTQEPSANRAVYWVAALGFVVTTVLTVAAFGLHLRD
jgi:succinate dehydrogenase/fumarate reductase cytochrome b subunit